jgi:PBSX family phage terminase large subunit
MSVHVLTLLIIRLYLIDIYRVFKFLRRLGFMDITLLEPQREFLEIPHKCNIDIALYQGGFGSGKTFSGSLLGILLCYVYPGIKGLVGAQTFPLVRDTTLATYLELLKGFGYEEKVNYRYLKSEQKIEFRNGSEIYFKSLENPNKLKSLNLGFVEIEEMSDISEDVFNMLIGRLRQQGIRVYRLFGHTNPSLSRGWLYNRFFKESELKTISYDYKDGDLIKTGFYKTGAIIKTESIDNKDISMVIRVIIAPSIFNPHLPKSQLLAMKTCFDPEYYKINVLGENKDYSSGLIVKGFNPKKQIIENICYDSNKSLHLSCDFNVDPMCWIIFQKDEHNIYFLDEIIVEKTTTMECIGEFVRRYPPEIYSSIILNGDASGANRSTTSTENNYRIIEQYLSSRGYRKVQREVKCKNPEILSRVQTWNSRMYNEHGECHIYFRGYRNRYNELVPYCKRLIDDIESLKFKPGLSLIDLPSPKDLKNDKKQKFYGHTFDAASYPVELYWPIIVDSTTYKQKYFDNYAVSRYTKV